MNRTTINYVLTTPDDQLKDDSHYFIPARAKIHSVVLFYTHWSKNPQRCSILYPLEQKSIALFSFVIT